MGGERTVGERSLARTSPRLTAAQPTLLAGSPSPSSRLVTASAVWCRLVSLDYCSKRSEVLHHFYKNLQLGSNNFNKQKVLNLF